MLCNVLLEDLVRSPVLQGSTRTIVDEVDRERNLLVCHGLEIGLLREELAQQSVGVFVQSTLAGAVGMCAVNDERECTGDRFVISDLPSVVMRHGVPPG